MYSPKAILRKSIISFVIGGCVLSGGSSRLGKVALEAVVAPRNGPLAGRYLELNRIEVSMRLLSEQAPSTPTTSWFESNRAPGSGHEGL
jgi:hypothetical protein